MKKNYIKSLLKYVQIGLQYVFRLSLFGLLLGFKGDAKLLVFRPGNSPKDFFIQRRFLGNFDQTLPISDIEATIQKIKKEVPKSLRYYACEHLYYLVQGKKDYSFELQYLDAFDNLLPADSMRAFTQIIRAEIFIKQQDLNKARSCLTEVIDICTKNGSNERLADALRALSSCDAREGNYDKAIKNLFVAETYYNTRTTDHQRVGYYETIYAIGSVFALKKDYNNAFTWFKKTYDYVSTFLEHEADLFVIADRIGQNYFQQGQIKEAENWYWTADEWLNKLNRRLKVQYTYDVAPHWALAGYIAYAKQKHTLARAAFQQAMTINDGGRKPTALYRYCMGLADTYRATKQYDSAAVYYQIALKNNDLSHKLDVYKGLEALYQAQGMFKEVVAAKDSIYWIEKVLFTVEKDRQITEMQALKDVAEKEKALAEAQEERRFLLLLSLLLGILIFFVIALYRDKIREQDHQEQLRRLELEAAEAEATNQQYKLERMSRNLAIKNIELQETEKMLVLKNSLIQDLEHRLNEPLPLISQTRPPWRFLTAEDWERFTNDFDAAFPGFVSGMLVQLPKLTPSEIRLLLLLKIGLDSSEVAQTLGISAESVYKSRYRLRQKLGLSITDNLEAFVKDFKI